MTGNLDQTKKKKNIKATVMFIVANMQSYSVVETDVFRQDTVAW